MTTKGDSEAMRWWEFPADFTGGTPELAQGDVLLAAQVPMLSEDFASPNAPAPEFATADLIIITQSCDLASGDSRAPVNYVTLLEAADALSICSQPNPPERWSKKTVDRFRAFRKGHRPGFHPLMDWSNPPDTNRPRLVNLKEPVSLPIGYVRRHLQAQQVRPRLQSPHREHVSQAYARCMMRVGLPSPMVDPVVAANS